MLHFLRNSEHKNKNTVQPESECHNNIYGENVISKVNNQLLYWSILWLSCNLISLPNGYSLKQSTACQIKCYPVVKIDVRGFNKTKINDCLNINKIIFCLSRHFSHFISCKCTANMLRSNDTQELYMGWEQCLFLIRMTDTYEKIQHKHYSLETQTYVVRCFFSYIHILFHMNKMCTI